MSAKQTWILLASIVLLGTGLRLFALSNNSFVADEFLDINSSYGYTQTGQWRAWDFNFGKASEVNQNVARDERAIIYKWQVAELFHFLSPTERNARLISVLWGALSMGVIFWSALVFTRRREIGLISAFLFAVAVNAIIYDRTLRMYAMFLPLYLFTATCAFLSLERAYSGKIALLQSWWEKYGINIIWAIASGGLLYLALLTHQLAGTFVFFIALYLLIRAVQEFKSNHSVSNKYFILFTCGAILLVATAVFLPKLFRSYAAGLIFFDNNYSYAKYILRDYYHPFIAVLLIAFGSWWLAKRENMPRESLWLTLSLLAPLAMAMWLWRRNMGAQYIYFAESFATILAAIGIYGVWTLLCEKFVLTSRVKITMALGLLLLVVPNFGYFFQENNTYHETSSGDNPNYRKVFTYFKKNHLATDVLVTRNMRNYYFAGAHVPVYDLGDEISQTRLSQGELEKLMMQYKTGWVILSDNDYDYVAKGMKEYLAKNLTPVSNDQVRGSIDVYTWGQ
jgi:hypothetical protein